MFYQPFFIHQEFVSCSTCFTSARSLCFGTSSHTLHMIRFPFLYYPVKSRLHVRLLSCFQEHRPGSPDQAGNRGNQPSPPHQVLFSHLPLHSQLQVFMLYLSYTFLFKCMCFLTYKINEDIYCTFFKTIDFDFVYKFDLIFILILSCKCLFFLLDTLYSKYITMKIHFFH